MDDPRRFFKCDAEDCDTTHTAESDAFKHAIRVHYHLLQRYPKDYACFVDECERKLPNPSALERHYTTEHCPPGANLSPTKDPMLPVRTALLYHVSYESPPSDSQILVADRPLGTCLRCSFATFLSDMELARHIYRYHHADLVALKTVAHIPAASCRTCPPALYTGKPPVLFSLAGLKRHYAEEHKGLKMKRQETMPLLRPVTVRDGLLRLREQKMRWKRREGMDGGGDEEAEGNTNEYLFEGLGSARYL